MSLTFPKLHSHFYEAFITDHEATVHDFMAEKGLDPNDCLFMASIEEEGECTSIFAVDSARTIATLRERFVVTVVERS